MAPPTDSWTRLLTEGVEKVRAYKRAQTRVDEWFYVQELMMKAREALKAQGKNPEAQSSQPELLCRLAREMPLSIPEGTVIAGAQDCAFSPSYALINPSFRVETFAGYCDPTAVYDDIEPDPDAGLTQERIDRVRRYFEKTPYVRRLKSIYEQTGDETGEVVYFVEQVTGHTIPDLRPFLENGVKAMQAKARNSGKPYGALMADALEAVLILAERYRRLALKQARQADADEKVRLEAMADVLARVPSGPATNLHEAIQTFALLWEVMVLEQAPNPYAFSVGNLDRILAPYYDEAVTPRDAAVALVRHLLTFFQVGSRSWAISQNVLVGGKDAAGNDLTCDMTYIVLDAFFTSNDPQPALSMKVHSGTPEALWRSVGRFFFTPGHSTPSLLNDDTVFEMLRGQGIAEEDLPDYSIAGCQEPLIMGKSSLNTTNSWLNLGKVLELAANDGKSLITGKQIGPGWADLGVDGGADEAYGDLESVFFKMLDHFLPRMQHAANACTTVLGECKPVPFTSAVMDSFSTWRDMRDPTNPGVRYNASGCLIHGLTVVANSLHAVGRALESGVAGAEELRTALTSDFEGADDLHTFLLRQSKFGSDLDDVDPIAVRIANEVSDRVRSLRNPAGNPFLADWSTPSTHLLYGYWVGATPDGRRARKMLNFGVDPLPGLVREGLPGRIASTWKLPFLKMTGGYASHVGLRASDPPAGADLEAKGLWLRERIVGPLFKLGAGEAEAPFYVYFNVDDAHHLREVLKNPEKYAPDGIYIMRIHGTFVNFLDLSPAIQNDIIERLDPSSRAA